MKETAAAVKGRRQNILASGPFALLTGAEEWQREDLLFNM